MIRGLIYVWIGLYIILSRSLSGWADVAGVLLILLGVETWNALVSTSQPLSEQDARSHAAPHGNVEPARCECGSTSFDPDDHAETCPYGHALSPEQREST